MNQFIPIIYLTLVFIILISIAILITVEIFDFYNKQFTLDKLTKNHIHQVKIQKQYHEISNAYIKQKLWILALNNLENYLQVNTNNVQYNQLITLNKIMFICKKLGFTIITGKYINLINKL